MRVLVTGGAGYVGRYVVRDLVQGGHAVTVVDDLSNSEAPPFDFVHMPCEDLRVSTDFDALVHLAGTIAVGDPARELWRNNVGAAISTLENVRAKKIVLASSAAVHGESAYGRTKRALEDLARDTFEGEVVILRPYNVAGGRERHKRETHLLPLALRATESDPLELHGESALRVVRDFVHVEDVADAFVRALEGLPGTYDVGTGVGTPVREVLDRVEAVLGRPVPQKRGLPRARDPKVLVAEGLDATARDLGWTPRRDLGDIIRSAWENEGT